MKTYALCATLIALTGTGCTTEAFCFKCEDIEPGAETGGSGGKGGSGGSGVVVTGGTSNVDPSDGGEGNENAGGDTSCSDDTKTDPFNCGSCGNVCNFQNAFPKCVKGECAIDMCFPGYLDANDLEGDGCEKGCVETNGGKELCDSLDNDCDGEVDEDFDLTSVDSCGSCNNVCNLSHAMPACVEVDTDEWRCRIATGGCEAGYYDNDGVHENGCEYACTKTSDDETCNGLDDDCDGDIDEGAPGAGVPCEDLCPGGDCKGQCTPGVTVCNGQQIVCVPAATTVGPSLELCDNVDNDCDGTNNEGFKLGEAVGDINNCGTCGNVCDDIPHAKLEKCENGVCKLEACEDGWKDLLQTPGNEGCEHKCEVWPPTAEVCDGKDNDCDGKVDAADNDMLGTSNFCLQGGPCAGAAPACSGGQWLCNYASLNSKITLDASVGYSSPETLCDNFDNNCDGRIDEGLNAYQACTGNNQCGSNSCNGGRCTCSNDSQCSFGYGCIDNFCHPTCFAGQGACQANGVNICQSNGSVACSVTATPNKGRTETCNGIDDNCDGQIDERVPGPGAICYNAAGTQPVTCTNLVDNMVQTSVAGVNVWIGQYEASRPDATSSNSGIIDNQRACQFPNRLPWTFVNQAAAEAACKLIKNSAGNPMRLCTQAEWQEACEDEVTAPTASWSFSTNPTTYAQNICNDKRFCTANSDCLSGTCTDGFCTCNGDAQCASREVCSGGYCTGKPWASGSVAACHTEYGSSGASTTNDIFDLSGNVAEWTSSGVSTDADPLTFEYFRVRGGGYSSFGPATACNFSFVLEKPSFANADVGFRCCSDAAP